MDLTDWLGKQVGKLTVASDRVGKRMSSRSISNCRRIYPLLCLKTPENKLSDPRNYSIVQPPSEQNLPLDQKV